MQPMAKTARNPIPAPKPAALPAVVKGLALLGVFEGTGVDADVGGGAVGVKVIVVSTPVTDITDVTGVADHEE